MKTTNLLVQIRHQRSETLWPDDIDDPVYSRSLILQRLMSVVEPNNTAEATVHSDGSENLWKQRLTLEVFSTQILILQTFALKSP